MFSGIIEEAATVVKLEKEKDNLHITMKCLFVNELKIDQSVSHNGVCLTVIRKDNETYTVTAIKETLEERLANESSIHWRDRDNKHSGNAIGRRKRNRPVSAQPRAKQKNDSQ